MIKSGAIYHCPTIELFYATVEFLKTYISNQDISDFISGKHWKENKENTYIAFRNNRIRYGNTKSPNFSNNIIRYGYEAGDYPATLQINLFKDDDFTL